MSQQTSMLEGEYHSLQILSLWRCQMLPKCGICCHSRKLLLHSFFFKNLLALSYLSTSFIYSQTIFFVLEIYCLFMYFITYWRLWWLHYLYAWNVDDILHFSPLRKIKRKGAILPEVWLFSFFLQLSVTAVSWLHITRKTFCSHHTIWKSQMRMVFPFFSTCRKFTQVIFSLA